MPPNDGVTDIPIPGDGSDDSQPQDEEETQMAFPTDDQNARFQGIREAGAEAFQALMTDIGHNGANVHNLARAVSVRKHDELGSVESRAHSGVMATPIATPTTQGG